LGLAAGAVLGMSIVALGAHDLDAAQSPAEAGDAPVVLPPHVTEPHGFMTEHLAARDSGVDWQRAEQWTEFGPAAVAAYER
jgi:hypothetical protein